MYGTIAERVSAGVALLDKRMPGWREEIDIEIFDMYSPGACILGQLFGGYSQGLTELGGVGGVSNGFDCTPDEYHQADSFMILRDEWLKHIRRGV